MKTTLGLRLALSLIPLTALPACGAAHDGDSGTGTGAAPAEPAPPPGGTLRVVVRAAGASAGNTSPLTVAPYTSCPPAGPPVGLKFVRTEAPALPATVDLTGLPAGRYHVLAFRGTGMQPAASDPQVCSAAEAEVTPGAGATLEVVLP